MVSTSPSGVSKSYINTLIIAMIVAGAANTIGQQINFIHQIVYKLQNKTEVGIDPVTNKPLLFVHPFMQATTMFVGEGLCIFIYLFYSRKQDDYKAQVIEAQARGLNVNVNYFMLAIPALSDLVTSTLQYIALNYISPSIYQMLRGGVIVITAIFSKYFLKKPQQKYQVVACGIVIVGITLVGISNFPPFAAPADDSSASTSQQLVAMLLIICSLITNGIFFISEEKLFSVYFLHPFQVVGSEGCWGFLMYLCLLPLLTFLPCPASLGSSCLNHGGDLFFERPDDYFAQMGSNTTLTFLVILGIFTIATFNIAGVSVTKYVSSVARSVVDVTRTVIIWIVGLIVTFSDPSQKWENTKWQAILIELLGFSVLIFGNLIYNKIIVIDYLMKESTVSDLQVSMNQNHNNTTTDDSLE